VRFTEINVLGVYVAPMSLMMVGAWVVTIALRRVASRFGLLRYIWHPALFVFAVYMIVLSSNAFRRALSAPCRKLKPQRRAPRLQMNAMPSGPPTCLPVLRSGRA
jgi:protein AaeX